MIHDPNDGAFRGDFERKSERGFFPAAPINHFPKAGAHRVDGDEGSSPVFAFAGDGLHDEQLQSFHGRIFDGANHVSDDARQLHFK